MGKLNLIILVLGVASLAGISRPAQAGDSAPLVIKINGLRSGKGFLAMSLFTKQESSAFPSDAQKASRTFYVPLEGKKAIEIPVENLSEGEYAVSVMHDEYADHKMHFNLLGIPLEGVGFSKNPTIYFGAPSFKRAAVRFENSAKLAAEPIEIEMKYFL